MPLGERKINAIFLLSFQWISWIFDTFFFLLKKKTPSKHQGTQGGQIQSIVVPRWVIWGNSGQGEWHREPTFFLRKRMKIALEFSALWPDAFCTPRCAWFETPCVLVILIPNPLLKSIKLFNEDDEKLGKFKDQPAPPPSHLKKINTHIWCIVGRVYCIKSG